MTADGSYLVIGAAMQEDQAYSTASLADAYYWNSQFNAYLFLQQILPNSQARARYSS